MSEQEDLTDPTVNAEGESVAVGRFSARDVNAPVIFGKGNILNVYESSEDEAPLSSEQIENGLNRLNEILPQRAPVLGEAFAELAQKLRATLGADMKALSPALKKQREEHLDAVKRMCMEVTEISFHGLCTGQNPPPYDPRSPFRGLESFRPEDNEFFFGREELTARLVQRIQSQSFLAVLGASGSGKSSLVMAGLIPALSLKYSVFSPGANPLEELEKARGNPLIIVDQFEELFTLTRDKDKIEEFINRLLDSTSSSKVVITLRSDFLGEVSHLRTLSQQIQNHLEIIPPMNAEELRSAMEKQASKVGLRFEADLSQQILEDVQGEPGMMPLLQHALWELWNRRHGFNLLSREYRAFGGVNQAITKTAEKVFSESTNAEQEEIRDIFLRLTRLDDSGGGRDTRRRVEIRELVPSGQNTDDLGLLLNRLVAARLVVKTTKDDTTEVEVAHEALIKYWRRLQNWINDNRGNLILHRQLVEAANYWNSNGRDAGDLYRGKKLAEALKWARTPTAEIGPLVQEFLKAGRAERTKEWRRRAYFSFSLIAVLFITIVFTFALWLLGGVRPLANRILPVFYPPDKMEWVKIPAGDFIMGSESNDPERSDEAPVHRVYLDAYEIGKYEVTNVQYLACVNAGTCRSSSSQVFDSPEYADHPVTGVSWADANKFCMWTDPNGRLPTEAEWEKAASWEEQTKTKRTYPWGNEIDCTFANYNERGTCGGDTMKVGSFPKGVGPYGAYDMAGNVWEWVADKYWEAYYQAYPVDQWTPNPTGPPEDIPAYVIRGGSWNEIDQDVRTTNRDWERPEKSNAAIGIRCARSTSP